MNTAIREEAGQPRPIVQLLRGFVFAVILIALFVAAGYGVRPSGIDGSVMRVKAFHSLEPNTAEVIVYGSSRAMRSVDPKVLYEEYGIGAYNYAGNWQKINTTAMFVHDSLQTQSPKVALIEVKNVSHLLWDTELNGELYYTREAPWSVSKLQYLSQCFRFVPERYISYVLPVFALHENWQAALSRKKSTKTVEAVLSHYGYAPSGSVREITFGTTDSARQLSGQSRAVLDDIVEKCHAAGTEVVFYVAPSSNKYHYVEAMTEYAKEHDCVFLDGYMRKNEIGIVPTTDYKDLYHLNKNGAEKMSRYLGQFLSDNYDLTDLRQTEGSLWEEEMSEVGA